MIICPSILESITDDYLKTIKKLSSFFNYFQLDIADGVYVKNKTAPIDDILKTLNTQQLLITNNYFDFHLMTKNYKNDIEKIFSYKDKIKIKNIFIHYNLKPKEPFFNNQKKSPTINHKSLINIGLAINPEDKISDLAKNYNLNSISIIQIMSVNPGAQGNPFIENTIKKIEQLRILGYRNKIFLDGGINDKTIHFILRQKFFPDVICPGSFLTKAKNETELKKRIDFLLKFIKKYENQINQSY